MRKFIKIGVIVLLASILLVIVSGFVFFGIVVFKNTMQLVTNERSLLSHSVNRLIESGFDLGGFENKYKIEKISIESSWDEHLIPADYILADGNKDRNTVIMVHGLGGNRVHSYPIAEIFLERGYNVLAYDQRSSGENYAPYTTFGYWESRDLVDYTNYIGSMISDDYNIVLHGTSFGGATTGIALGSDLLNEKVSLAILDSPISSLRGMLKKSMSNMEDEVPLEFVDFMMFTGDIITRLRLGFNYDDAEVVNHISRTKLPVLIIGSQVDTVTPFYMCGDIYDAILHGNKKLFVDKEAKHAQIFSRDRELYRETVFSFIENFGLLR